MAKVSFILDADVQEEMVRLIHWSLEIGHWSLIRRIHGSVVNYPG